jgi:hypothetical protein
MTSFRQSLPRFSPTAPNTRLPGSGDDASDGLLMFAAFTVAVLTSTAAVVPIALLGEWWVLSRTTPRPCQGTCRTENIWSWLVSRETSGSPFACWLMVVHRRVAPVGAFAAGDRGQAPLSS